MSPQKTISIYVQYPSSKHTAGGMDAKDALHWNDETNQRLGYIIQRLQWPKNRKEQIQGYCDFFELRRFFFADEWNKCIERFENMRIEKGGKTLESLLEEVHKILTQKDASLILKEETAIEAEPINKPTKKEPVTMGGMKKFCEGLRMAGEGLIQLSEELSVVDAALDSLLSDKDKVVGAVEKITTPEIEVGKRDEETPVKETKKEEPKEEKKIDFAALREQCISKATELSKFDKEALRAVNAEFGGKASSVSDDKLELLNIALTAALESAGV